MYPQYPQYPQYTGFEYVDPRYARQPSFFWQGARADRITVMHTLSPQPYQDVPTGLQAPDVPRQGVTPDISSAALTGATPGLPAQPIAPQSYQGLRAPRWQEAVYGLDSSGVAL